MSDSMIPPASAQTGGTATIDYSPLAGPIDRAHMREFKRAARASGELWAIRKPGTIILAVVVSVIVVIFGNILASIFANALSRSGLGGSELVRILAPVITVVVGGIFFLAWFGTYRTKWARWTRLDRFASANGFNFLPEGAGPNYRGVIFGVGGTRTSTDHVSSRRGRFFNIGNYRYSTGAGKSRRVHEWGFLAFRLDRKLPHMVLDARSNDYIFGGSNLPTRFTKDQTLSLEGNFDNYFTLYCPREYERDALYIFTPDLMTLLIDNAASFDVEIVDDWMFVYSRKPLDTQNPTMWQRMFQIMHTVGAKTLAQSENYRDERVVPAGTPAAAAIGASNNLIAPRGRRLRKKSNWISLVFVACFVAFWFYTFVIR